MATARAHLGVIAPLAAILAACAGPAEFVNRPQQPIAWPAIDAMPRVQFEFAYGSSADVVRHPGFFGWFSSLIAGDDEVAMMSPASIAHLGELLFVTDPGAGCVHRISLDDGSHLFLRGTTEHPFATPVGVAATPDGTMFVTDAATGYVTRLDRDGNASAAFGGPESTGRPTGIAYDRSRDRFVAVDTTGCRLLVLSRDGQILATHGRRGAAPGEFNYPTHVAVANDGRIAVVDSLNFRVQQFSPEFEFLHAFGTVGRGPGEFANPKGIAIDSGGNLHVVDSMFDNFQIFDRDGQLLLAVGTSGHDLGQMYLPNGIHIDADDRIWVADGGNGRVQVMQLFGVGPGAATNADSKATGAER